MATRSSFALFFLVNILLVFINVSLHAMSIAITVECRCYADNYFLKKSVNYYSNLTSVATLFVYDAHFNPTIIMFKK